MKIIVLSLLFCLLGSPIYSTPAVKASNKETLGFSADKAKVEFLSIGQPGIVKIRGTSNEDGAFQGKFSLEGQSLTGTVNFKLDSLDTGIALRNTHMKEKYLETKKYPVANFTLTQMSLPASFFSEARFKGEDIPFTGTLDIHGVIHGVEGSGEVEKNEDNLEWAFKFKIQVSDFKIPLANYMGITMSKEVFTDVRFASKLMKQ